MFGPENIADGQPGDQCTSIGRQMQEEAVTRVLANHHHLKLQQKENPRKSLTESAQKRGQEVESVVGCFARKAFRSAYKYSMIMFG